MGMIYSPGVAGSNGQIQFNSSGVVGADSQLYWDNTNKRFGLNNVSPTAKLDLTNNSASQAGLSITAAASQSTNLFEVKNSSGLLINNIDSSGNIKITNNSNPNIKLSAITGNNINGRVAWGANNLASESIRLLAVDQGFNGVASLAIDVSSNANNVISNSDRNVLFDYNGTTFYKSVSFSGLNAINIGNSSSNCGWYLGTLAISKAAILFKSYGFWGLGDLGLAVRTAYDNNQVTVSEIRLNVSGVNGCIGIGIGTTTPSAQLHIKSAGTATITQILQQTSSQSVAVLEAQNSAGTPKASITKDFELQTVVGSGAPSTTPVDGAMCVDTVNHRLYVRSGGTWKYTNLI